MFIRPQDTDILINTDCIERIYAGPEEMEIDGKKELAWTVYASMKDGSTQLLQCRDLTDEKWSEYSLDQLAKDLNAICL